MSEPNIPPALESGAAVAGQAAAAPAALPPRQLAALRAIVAFVAAHGYAPTLKQIGQAMGVTLGAARDHVVALQRKGFVRMDPNVARSLVVLIPPPAEERAA